jgi:hypothetical protein
MITRRLLMALPLLIAVPVWAQPADSLAAALVACWQARGIRFTVGQVTARIGGRTGRAALLAVAGAAISADEDEVETAVEILWEAGAVPSPARPLLERDLASGLPLLLITGAGRALLLHALEGGKAEASDPLSGEKLNLTMSDIALIGRPVIAGA